MKPCQLDPMPPINPIKLSSRTRLAAEVVEDETGIRVAVRDPKTWEYLDEFRAIRQSASREFVEV